MRSEPKMKSSATRSPNCRLFRGGAQPELPGASGDSARQQAARALLTTNSPFYKINIARPFTIFHPQVYIMALSLASLPPELIQLILRQCDPTSFLQAAFSCRAFLENASSSRDLTIHQLQNSPGTSAQDLEHLSHDQLFQRLLQISHRELYGAEFGSPSKLHTFGGRVIDAGASVLTAVGTLNQALLVFKGDSTVYLAKVDGGKFSLNRRIESPAKKYGKVDILHTALDSHGISVLHRLTPDEPNTKSSFVKHALESNTIFLARYDFQSDLETIMLYTFSKERDYDPLSFAAYEDKFAICWKHKTEEHTHRVNLYLTDPIDGEEEQESNALTDEDNDDDNEDHQIISQYNSISNLNLMLIPDRSFISLISPF